jgi:hypothetical protein
VRRLRGGASPSARSLVGFRSTHAPWQDELYLKFGLAFEILNPQFGETVFGASAFEQHPFLIARMDQLARNEDLLAELAKSEWDLVIVDEAHRMGDHYFAGKLEKTKRFQLGELRLAGVIPGQNVAVIAVQSHGDDAVARAYKTAEGDLGERVLGRDAEEKLPADQASWAFRPDARGDDLRYPTAASPAARRLRRVAAAHAAALPARRSRSTLYDRWPRRCRSLRLVNEAAG